MLLLRAFVIWLVFITVESVLGTLRVLFLERRMGAALAQRIGLIIGSAALLIVAYLFIWIRAEGRAHSLKWECCGWFLPSLSKWSFGNLRGRSWKSLLADYDVTRGGLMPVALVLLLFAPLIAVKLRSRKSAAFHS